MEPAAGPVEMFGLRIWMVRFGGCAGLLSGGAGLAVLDRTCLFSNSAFSSGLGHSDFMIRHD